jgi:tRNA threonylcarbamoyladenosine biosynthesis protein TsaE
MDNIFISNSCEETRNIACEIAKRSSKGDIFGLIGPLGVGKTEFVRGFVTCLCGDSYIRSPTFSIVNIYESRDFLIYHFDFYRIKKKEELIEIGYYDYITDENSIVLIEWADLFIDALPEKIKYVRFKELSENKREIVMEI